MRTFFLIGCLAVCAAAPGLVGCKTSDPASGPSWSLSDWNPFKSTSEEPLYPQPPSRYAQPADAGSGYASTGGSPSATTDGGEAGGASAYAPSPYASASTPYGTTSTPGLTDNSYSQPQQGYYQAGGSYPNTSQGPITPTDPSRYVGSARGTVASNPYRALDERAQAPSGYGTATANPPYASSANSPYVAEAAGSTKPSSTSLGDRPFQSYYQASPSSAGASSSSNPYAVPHVAQGDTAPQPPSDYARGSSAGRGYVPGQTGYTPGDTGYQPPGVPPYQSPASPYVPPGAAPAYSASGASPQPPSTGSYNRSSAEAFQGYEPYRPGSIKPYTRGSTTDSAGGSDAGVQAAEYVQPPETRRL